MVIRMEFNSNETNGTLVFFHLYSIQFLGDLSL
jgi:hypothetical protein